MEEAQTVFQYGGDGVPVEGAWYIFLGSFFVSSVVGRSFIQSVIGPIFGGLVLLVGGRRVCEGSARPWCFLVR